MNGVYILFEVTDDECFSEEVKGVFSTLDRAQAAHPGAWTGEHPAWYLGTGDHRWTIEWYPVDRLYEVAYEIVRGE